MSEASPERLTGSPVPPSSRTALAHGAGTGPPASQGPRGFHRRPTRLVGDRSYSALDNCQPF